MNPTDEIKRGPSVPEIVSSREAQARLQKLARDAIDRYLVRQNAVEGMTGKEGFPSRRRFGEAKTGVQRAAREYDAAGSAAGKAEC